MMKRTDVDGNVVTADPTSKYAGAITIGAILLLVAIRVTMEKK